MHRILFSIIALGNLNCQAIMRADLFHLHLQDYRLLEALLGCILLIE